MRGRMSDTVVYGKCCSPYTQITVAAVIDTGAVVVAAVAVVVVDIAAVAVVAVAVIRSRWVGSNSDKPKHIIHSGTRTVLVIIEITTVTTTIARHPT